MILSLSANGLIVINASEWISPSAEGDQMAPPFGNLPPLKRWTKLFAFVLICADFIIGTSVVLPTKEQLLFYSFFVPASQAASSIS